VEIRDIEMTSLKKVLVQPTEPTIDKNTGSDGEERGHKDLFSLLSEDSLVPGLVMPEPPIYICDPFPERFAHEKKRKTSGQNRAYPRMKSPIHPIHFLVFSTPERQGRGGEYASTPSSLDLFLNEQTGSKR